MRIVTNFERFEANWTARGQTGSAVLARDFAEFRRELPQADLILINGDIGITLRLCALFWICPWKRKPLVVADLVLRRPRTASARAAAWIKRLLLRRVDHFVNYFRDVSGYSACYGITAQRSSFVPFKPNLRYRYEPDSHPAQGQYILCLGRSQRDFDTFFDAMAQLPYPAAIPKPDFPALRQHDSRFTRRLDQLPPNIGLLDDDGSQASMIRAIEGARIIALPILPSSIAASGISVYLNAMLMSKPVVISAGPGASDILDGEALIVPPEDPDTLAEALRRLWEDDSAREQLAQTGRRYALGLGGEPELRARILDAAMRWYLAR